LRVLGLQDEARAFREALEKSATHVSSRSREFWRRAAERDLNLRPDLEILDEEDNGIGPRFLCEYELKRKEARSIAEEKLAATSLSEAGYEEPAMPVNMLDSAGTLSATSSINSDENTSRR